MKSAGKARNNGLYRHIRTSKEIIRNLLNDYYKYNIGIPRKINSAIALLRACLKKALIPQSLINRSIPGILCLYSNF